MDSSGTESAGLRWREREQANRLIEGKEGELAAGDDLLGPGAATRVPLLLESPPH